MQDAVAIAAKALTSQAEKQQAVPFWKPMLLLAMVITACAVSLRFSMPWGLLVLGAAILFHMLGGFNTSGQQPATRFRIFSFGFAWFCVTIMSVGAQFVFPAFEELFQAIGPANVPLPTRLVMKWYPLLTLLPKLVGSIWMFWPSRATSLRAAIVVSCLSVGLIVLAVAALYLPLWQVRAVV